MKTADTHKELQAPTGPSTDDVIQSVTQEVSVNLNTALGTGTSTDSTIVHIPENYQKRFHRCLQATSPLLLCDTKMGPVIEQENLAGPNTLPIPTSLWSKERLEARLAKFLADANPTPDTATLLGRVHDWARRWFTEEKTHAPPPSPELRETLLQMAGFVEQGREGELRDIFNRLLKNTNVAHWLQSEGANAKSTLGLEAAFKWLDGGNERGLGVLSCKLAIARGSTALWLNDLKGLVPGAPCDERHKSAENLLVALNRYADASRNVWTLDKIEREVFLDPRNLGYVSLYVTEFIPSKNAEELAQAGFMIGGIASLLANRSVETPRHVPAIIVTLRNKLPEHTATHEADHIVTDLCRTGIFSALSFEGGMLDEMRSQLGDPSKSVADIRKLLLSQYSKTYSEMALAELDRSGESQNLIPGTKRAEIELGRFIDRVETLLEKGIPRDEIRALLRFVATLPDFYNELKKLENS
jgi:hypothetical protein